MTAPMQTLRGGWSFNMKKTWMSVGEREAFKALRDAGAITVFRTATCVEPSCGNEIPKGKLYCSVKCMNAVEGVEDEQELFDNDDW